VSLLVDRRGVLAQPTAVAFPSTGLIGRLRADSIAQADGSAVATWPGLVGGNAVQATPGNQPTLKTSDINSKPSVQFVRASTQYLDWAGVSASVTPMTLLVVLKYATIVSGEFYYALGASGNGGNGLFLQGVDASLALDRTNTDNCIKSNPSIASAATPVALLVAYDPNVPPSVGSGYFYRNGSLFTTANLFSRVPTAARTTVVGRDPSFAAALNGTIAEIAKWDHQLDATERAAVFAYTLARYGI
jgi:hypothetical protein